MRMLTNNDIKSKFKANPWKTSRIICSRTKPSLGTCP